MLKSWIRIRIKVKILELLSRGGPWTLTMEAWRLKMEPCESRCSVYQWSPILITVMRSRTPHLDPDMH
jgi:hypothetical protein